MLVWAAQGFHWMRASFPCTLECSEERFLSAVAEIKARTHAGSLGRALSIMDRIGTCAHFAAVSAVEVRG